MSEQAQIEIREEVRQRYAAAAAAFSTGQPGGCCGAPSEAGGCGEATAQPEGTGACCCGGPAVRVEPGFGAGLYDAEQRESLSAEALAASLGCGNPHAVADLRDGETVLDLGSGAGIDVLLSARRVGPHGKAYGLDMTEEMLALAAANARQAGVRNVEFLKGTIEDVPLPAGTVDVIISNCVINLSTDKPAVFAEAYRVLKPGGRVGVTDVVAEDQLSVAERGDRGSYVGCIAGALSIGEYTASLAEAGFTGIAVEPTHAVADGMHSAIIRATKPGTS